MEINVSSREGALPKNSITSSSKIHLEDIHAPIHFVGIGGIGMSALARLLLARGKKVSGSDKQASEITEELQQLGADIHIGHGVNNFVNAGCLVISTAISADNPELVKAKELKIPVVHRSEMLSELTRGKKLIGVSGTHGKTTTTGMIAQTLIDGNLDPSVVVGGVFPKIKSNARHGDNDYFVAEIDESDGTQTVVQSYISIVTNIETDHLENYPGGINDIVKAMRKFIDNTQKCVVLCADDVHCRELRADILATSALPVVTYGLRNEKNPCDYSFENVGSFGLKIYRKDEVLGTMNMSVPGEHNKYNALATLVVALELGMDFKTIAESLKTFTGVNRRFQLLGEEKNILVVDDYAHHPTEVDATCKGAQQYIAEYRIKPDGAKGRLVILFQPHQPGRLKNHWNEFLKCFDDADLVFISDIYIARGKEIAGVTSEGFVKELKHANAHYISGSVSELAAKVIPYLQPYDLIMTVGAGDITSVGPKILDLLKQSS